MKLQRGRVGMAKASLGLAISSALALTACQQEPATGLNTGGSQPVARIAPEGFACPPEGTRVTFGSVFRVHGVADRDDPFICVGTTSTGQTFRAIGNFFTADPSTFGIHRQYLPQLWPLTPGRSFSYNIPVQTQQGENFLIRHTYRVIGPAQVAIAGADRNVVVIERDQRNPNWAGYFVTWRFYYDPVSRVFLGGEKTVVQGNDTTPNWRATNVQLPTT
jgi:hypothetical protein